MRGGGIALALSIAGLVNTVFLFLFFRKNKNVALGALLKHSGFYSIKMCALSLIAVIPVLFLSPRIHGIAESLHINNKLITDALPLVASFIVFAVFGILLLLLCRDKYLKMLLGKILARKIKSEK
jgi:putative peptidoglycan lipid II flippase